MARLLTTLRSSLPNLSPVLQRVAQYVLDDPGATIYHSVTELAEATRASEGSIIRFCKDLGFSGFQEFKLTLAVEFDPLGRERRPLGGGQASTRSEPAAEGEIADLMGHLVATASTALLETADLFDPESFGMVAQRLAGSDRIDVYGVGASGVVAQYFAYRLLRLGLTAQAHADVHLAAMSATNLRTGGVAIGISSSGSTLDTLRALTLAKEAGAFTVAVTNRLRSPLAKVADRSLFASPPESPLTGGDVFAKIGQLLVMEALARLMVAHDEALRGVVERTARVVADRSM